MPDSPPILESLLLAEADMRYRMRYPSGMKFMISSNAWDALIAEIGEEAARRYFDPIDECPHDPTYRSSIVFGKRFEMCRRCGKILDE